MLALENGVVTVTEDAFRFTKSGPERFNAMITSLKALNDHAVDGDVVECGVWHGGNIILARHMCPERVCWLYDTFSGMTKPDPTLDIKFYKGRIEKAIDRYEAMNGNKWSAVSLDDVKLNFESFGLLDDRYLKFVEGDVEDTLMVPGNVPDKICLLRLDTDWYHSTKIELEILYPRLVTNGVLIIDDYGHWAGCRKAVDEYFFGRPMTWQMIDYTAILTVKTC
jgi:O-methyltransferase